MKKHLGLVAVLFVVLLGVGCKPIVVNSLEDIEDPPDGTVTLRSALARAFPGQPITFDESLDGGTIELTLIAWDHTILKGEVMGIRDEPSGPVSFLDGYYDRDYGPSALFGRWKTVIDASDLPSGITLRWTGGEQNPARVLAVRGDLTLRNVTVTGGWSVAEELPAPDPDDERGQLSTRARGAGIAVWGVARIDNCTIHDNHCRRDASVPARSRDAGVFGGGVYADIVEIDDSVISGNSLVATGVSGGGVFSVGGADTNELRSRVRRSAVTGNRISGIFTYGAGVYSDGGGIGKAKTLELVNSTITRNVVEPMAGLPGFYYGIGYWRGGGAYMSNGYMDIHGCTIVENEVSGYQRTDSVGRPNLAGGVAATIGNAHAVEDMSIGHSVIAGNIVEELGDGGERYHQDIFTGSLLYFRSMGYNRFGTLDFSQILVPVGEPGWASLSRKHYPQDGDEDGVLVEDVLNVATGITYSDAVLSVGTDTGELAVLHYDPRGSAVDQVPTSIYNVGETFAEYDVESGSDDFLEIALERLQNHYDLPGFAAAFTDDFEDFLESVDLDDATEGNQPYLDPRGDPILTLAETDWFGPAETWPKELANHPYIHFWHRLDTALIEHDIDGMGFEVLGDAEWRDLFDSGRLSENPNIMLELWTRSTAAFELLPLDQIGTRRPEHTLGDIGAIELLARGSASATDSPTSSPSPTKKATRPRIKVRR